MCNGDRVWRTIFCIVVTGCGRVGFDPLVGEPAPIAELNSPSEDEDPTLSADLLEIYFISTRPGGLGGSDIYRATRAGVELPWDAPQNVAELNSSDDELGPELSRDGRVMVFAAGPTTGDLFVTTRSDAGAPWAVPVAISELATAALQDSPTITEDLLLLVVSRNRGSLVASSRVTPAMPWGPAAVVAELESTAADLSPHVDAGGTRILFASDRSGSRDIWFAQRGSRAVPFSPPLALDAVNTAVAEESDPWLSADGRTLFFKSDRAGENDLFVARLDLP